MFHISLAQRGEILQTLSDIPSIMDFIHIVNNHNFFLLLFDFEVQGLTFHKLLKTVPSKFITRNQGSVSTCFKQSQLALVPRSHATVILFEKPAAESVVARWCWCGGRQVNRKGLALSPRESVLSDETNRAAPACWSYQPAEASCHRPPHFRSKASSFVWI